MSTPASAPAAAEAPRMTVSWLGQTWPAASDFTKWIGPEASAVEEHFGGKDIDKLNNRQATYAIAFVTIKRHVPTFTWRALDSLTLEEVTGLIELADDGEPADPTGADEASSTD